MDEATEDLKPPPKYPLGWCRECGVYVAYPPHDVCAKCEAENTIAAWSRRA
jgi:uncharacterized OB-fold protein